MALTHASAKPAFAGHVVFWTYQFMEHVLVRRAARTEARAEESTVPISGYNDHTEFSVHQNQQRPHRAPLWPHRRHCRRHCRRHRIHRASTRSLLQNSERHERMTSEAQLAAITVVPHPHSSKNRAPSWPHRRPYCPAAKCIALAPRASCLPLRSRWQVACMHPLRNRVTSLGYVCKVFVIS